MLCLSIVIAAAVTRFCHGFITLDEEDDAVECLKRHFCNNDGFYFGFKGCSCDPTCKIYGDCCQDSEYYDESEQRTNWKEYKCFEVEDGEYVYMKGKCLESWHVEREKAEVQEYCHGEKSISDLAKRLPVTSTATNSTYVNYYCAVCNEDSVSLRMWYAKVVCKDVPLLFGENFGVVFRDGQWGVFSPGQDASSFTPCAVYFKGPTDIGNLATQCRPKLQTCSDSWTDETELLLCKSYTAVVYDGKVAYRNEHCAICNGIKNYKCKPDVTQTIRPASPFTMLLDFSDRSGNDFVGYTGPCETTTEIWDRASGKCRKIICPRQDDKLMYGKCVTSKNVATHNGKQPQVTTPPAATPSTFRNTRNVTVASPLPTHGSTKNKDETRRPVKTNMFSAPQPYPPNTSFSDTLDPEDSSSRGPSRNLSYDGCLKVALSEEEFVRQLNGTVYVPAHERTYQAAEYEEREGHVLVCWSVDSSVKFSPAMGWVNLACLGLSCMGLLLHLTAFCLSPNLRNLSGRCLASLCLSLMAAYITILVNMFDPPREAGCVVLAAAMYYFFLSSFTWMSTIAFDVWYVFLLTQRELRVASGSQNHRFLPYSVYSWLLPGVLTAVLVTVDQLEPKGISVDFLPRLGQGWCWISHRKSLLVFFAVPMAALIMMNIVFFACTAARITKMTRSAAIATTAGTGPQRQQQYITFLRLAVLMGLTWITGIAAGCLDVEALWYIFIILNSLQGVFIFLAFTCRTKVLQEVVLTRDRMMQRAASLLSRRPLAPDDRQQLQLSQTSQQPSSFCVSVGK